MHQWMDLQDALSGAEPRQGGVLVLDRRFPRVQLPRQFLLQFVVREGWQTRDERARDGHP